MTTAVRWPGRASVPGGSAANRVDEQPRLRSCHEAQASRRLPWAAAVHSRARVVERLVGGKLPNTCRSPVGPTGRVLREQRQRLVVRSLPVLAHPSAVLAVVNEDLVHSGYAVFTSDAQPEVPVLHRAQSQGEVPDAVQDRATDHDAAHADAVATKQTLVGRVVPLVAGASDGALRIDDLEPRRGPGPPSNPLSGGFQCPSNPVLDNEENALWDQAAAADTARTDAALSSALDALSLARRSDQPP